MVKYYGNGQWSVYYVPHADASGVDTFTYSASDCPGDSTRWSPNVGTVTLNVVPVGVAATVRVARGAGGAGVDTVIDLSLFSVTTANFTDSPALKRAAKAAADADVRGGLSSALISSAPAVVSQPLTYTVTALPAVGGTLRDVAGPITSVPYQVTGSKVYFTATACCTSYAACSAAQIAQQTAQNLTSFAYASSDPTQRAPVQVLLGIACPAVAQPPASVAVISVGAIVALAVAGACMLLGLVGTGVYYRRSRVKHQAEMRVLAEENEQKVKAAENEALLASKEQEQLRSIMGNVVRETSTDRLTLRSGIRFIVFCFFLS